jgi:hypothetical protein
VPSAYQQADAECGDHESEEADQRARSPGVRQAAPDLEGSAVTLVRSGGGGLGGCEGVVGFESSDGSGSGVVGPGVGAGAGAAARSGTIADPPRYTSEGAAVPMLGLRAALRTEEEGVLRDRFEEFD